MDTRPDVAARRRGRRWVLLLCAAGVALAGCGGADADADRADPGNGPAQDPPAAEPAEAPDNGIFRLGHTWQLTFSEDDTSVAADGSVETAVRAVRFEVVEAPKDPDGPWLVRMTEAVPTPPFEEGFMLSYVLQEAADRREMVLTGVGPVGRDLIEPENAEVILGQGFPLPERFDAPPTSSQPG